MGIHLQCPVCGAPGSDTVSSDARWGMLYDENELERAFDAAHDATDTDDTYAFLDQDGRRTFECPCGRALWIADRREAGQPSAGRWLITSSAP